MPLDISIISQCLKTWLEATSVGYLRFILLLIKCTGTWSKWEEKSAVLPLQLGQLYSSNVNGCINDISNADPLWCKVVPTNSFSPLKKHANRKF